MEFTVKHNFSDNWAMQKPHFHDQLEILLSLTEGGTFFLMNRLHPIRRGTLLILQNQVLHRSIGTEGQYERYVLHIPPKTLSEASTRQTDFTALLRQSHCIQLEDEDFGEMRELMERCSAVSPEPGEDIRQLCAFLSLLVLLEKLLRQQERQQPTPEGFSPPVRQAMDHINAHLSEDLRLDLLANCCHVSKYHLCRLFREETSFTVGEYILQLRLRHAAALLRSGETVQKAGEEAGFQSSSHFIRAFGQTMGLSPGRYRKQYVPSR